MQLPKNAPFKQGHPHPGVYLVLWLHITIAHKNPFWSVHSTGDVPPRPSDKAGGEGHVILLPALPDLPGLRSASRFVNQYVPHPLLCTWETLSYWWGSSRSQARQTPGCFKLHIPQIKSLLVRLFKVIGGRLGGWCLTDVSNINIPRAARHAPKVVIWD